MTVFIGNSEKTEHWFFWRARREFQVCISPGQCLFPSVSKGGHKFLLLALRGFQPVRKSMHSKEIGSKHFPTGSHASQHRMSKPRYMFLYARKAVEAVKSLAPRLPGVSRRSSRTVRLLDFSRIILKSASAPKRVFRV